MRIRAGTISAEDWLGAEGGIARSHGTCMTMGTASTMTGIIEMSLPGASSIPADDSNHTLMAAESGRRKLVKQGVLDMLRLSDSRMSGTSYGACILHVAPESFVGGPLALVRYGDLISIDINARSIRLEVSDEELARRKSQWKPPPERYQRGYGYVFSKHIRQANEGCDLDFLQTDFGAPVPEPVIY